MALSPSSSLRFRQLDGAEISAPREWQPCLVEVIFEPENWDGVSIARNGTVLTTRLERVAGRPRIIAPWPRSGTGSYRLDLATPGHQCVEIVDVLPEKITTTEYRQLIDDLEGQLPATIALSVQRAGALAGIDLRPPTTVTLEEEVLRLRRAIIGDAERPGLVTVLPAISRDPHGILATTELWVRRRQVRRPLSSALVKAVSRGWNIDSDQRPRQAVDARVEYTTDVYENRLVKSYVREINFRIRHIVASIQASGNQALVQEATDCLDRLTRARRSAPFLDAVQEPTHLLARPSMVFLRRPDYRAAFEGYLEFHRTVAVRLFDERLAAPLENLPALYEAWGTLQVLSALIDVAEGLDYRVEFERLFSQRSGELFLRLLPDGQPALSLFHPALGRIRFIPQRAYGRSGPVQSVSYRQVPDVSIDITASDKTQRILIFDPKYKLVGETLTEPGDGLTESEAVDLDITGRDDGAPDHASSSASGTTAGWQKPKKIDIDTMHAYRDSIRTETDEHLVSFAAILYPGSTVRYGSGLAAIGVRPSDPTYQLELRRILTDALSSAETPCRPIPEVR
jgi:hypothetical protein